LADDVYDGVFEKLVITENTGTENEKSLYDSRKKGFEAVKFNLKQFVGQIVNWFITNL